MKFLVICFILNVTLLGEESNQPGSVSNLQGVNSDLFDSDFFSGVLDEAGTDEDAMGTQRLIDLRNTSFTPSLNFSTSYNYSSNPLKAKSTDKIWEDGFSLTLNLMANLGLGEIGIGDEVISAPSLLLVQMRTYSDPIKDQGEEMQPFDVDVQIATFSLPFILPNDFTLSIGHAYTRPISFRTDNVISYSNTPSISLSKNFALQNGDIFTFTTGASYSFTNGDTLEQQINDPVYYQFIEQVMGGPEAVLAQQPTTLQDAWTHLISASYIRPINDKLLFSPTLNFSKMIYTEGVNTGREDTLTSLGFNFSYAFTDWLNATAVSNYTWKKSDTLSIPEYEDLTGGVAFGINYAF